MRTGGPRRRASQWPSSARPAPPVLPCRSPPAGSGTGCRPPPAHPGTPCRAASCSRCPPEPGPGLPQSSHQRAPACDPPGKHSLRAGRNRYSADYESRSQYISANSGNTSTPTAPRRPPRPRRPRSCPAATGAIATTAARPAPPPGSTADAREIGKHHGREQNTAASGCQAPRGRPARIRAAGSGHRDHHQEEYAEIAQRAGFVEHTLGAAEHAGIQPYELRSVPAGAGN